jgi:hypothetical protein
LTAPVSGAYDPPVRHTWLFLLLLLAGTPAHGGVVSYGSNDFCENDIPLITKGPLEFVNTAVAPDQSVPAFFIQTDNYRYRATSTGVGGTFDLGYVTCQKLSSFQINNATEEQPLGEVLPEDAYPDDQILPDWLLKLSIGISGLIRENSEQYHPCDQQTDLCGFLGIRGSLEVQEVLELETASPAWYTFQPAGSLGGLDSLAIPFVVLEPGTGDSLSMYLGSQLFFQQPLAQFDPGRLYFAVVPVAGVDNNPAITLWINSFGPAGTRVAIPTAVTPVPLPSTAWLCLTGLVSLAVGARRTRRASGPRPCTVVGRRSLRPRGRPEKAEGGGAKIICASPLASFSIQKIFWEVIRARPDPSRAIPAMKREFWIADCSPGRP